MFNYNPEWWFSKKRICDNECSRLLRMTLVRIKLLWSYSLNKLTLTLSNYEYGYVLYIESDN